MPDLRIVGLQKRFGDVTALDDVTISGSDGEMLTLLGPSGCGKSTTLWSIAGLHRPDGGTIAVGDTTFYDSAAKTDLPPEARNCGVVFQSYAVWPHLTVADNVGYPLKLRRIKHEARRRRVAEVLELVEMGEFATRYPHELSGGQQQRVALARALAHPPALLLLDEPFSNLDAKLRERARIWLRQLQHSIGVTTVFVTHDQHEALSMSDRIVVMRQGAVHQIGTPEEVYRQPADLFVADFVGTVNLVDATVLEQRAGVLTMRIAGVERPIRAVSQRAMSGAIKIAVRPEAFVLDETADGDADNTISGPVVSSSFLGDHYRYQLQVGDAVVTVQSDRNLGADRLRLHIPPDAIQLFDVEATDEQDPTDAP